MTATHLRAKRGARCGRGKELTCDEYRVTCWRCRTLGAPVEEAPDNAFRTNVWLPLTQLDAGERGILNLHNIIYVDGGSILWFEEPNIVALMPAREGGAVHRYEGKWETRA